MPEVVGITIDDISRNIVLPYPATALQVKNSIEYDISTGLTLQVYDTLEFPVSDLDMVGDGYVAGPSTGIGTTPYYITIGPMG